MGQLYYTKCILSGPGRAGPGPADPAASLFEVERYEIRESGVSPHPVPAAAGEGVSQRTAAEALGISQALLSHYENGVREPGLVFVVKACDYYGVSADFLLGRTLTRDGATISPDELYDISDEKNNSLKGACWPC